MALPDPLKQIIESLTGKIKLQRLQALYQELSERYRSGKEQTSSLMQSEGHRLAYLAGRFPATYAAIEHVFLEILDRVPDVRFNSFLDVGSGPGTGIWCAKEVFYGINRITAYEQNKDLIQLGKQILQMAPESSRQPVEWVQGDLQKKMHTSHHDLILASYVIGELNQDAVRNLILDLWKATKKILVVIEPGTPKGFSNIRQIRQEILNEGAFVVAPCPHANECPLSKQDWCHFYQRIPRSLEHRSVKSGILNYEDEKFSYVVLSKQPVELPSHRILRHPVKQPGQVCLTVCTQNGIKNMTVSRREKEKFRQFKKIKWGEIF